MKINYSMAMSAESIYQIKITLRDIKPPIWRRIELKGNTSLNKLHEIIQESFGWWNSHLHQFDVDGEFYGVSYPEADFHVKSSKRFKLYQAAPAVGDKFFYEYDFGDGWLHEIKVEAITEAEKGVKYPRCIKGKRSGPPEDVGGPWGYEHFLEAISNPEHDEHEEYLEWIGGSFDPEACDLETINGKYKLL